MESVTIDRIEGDIAVCERDDLTFVNIKKDDLPAGAKPGSILLIGNNGLITLDTEEEIRRRRRISDLYKSIVKKEE